MPRWRHSTRLTLPSRIAKRLPQAWARIAHGFTHYRLTLLPLRWREVAPRAFVRDNEDLRWVARDELSALGIPAPIRTLLEAQPRHDRSEEHTSELQSLMRISYAVFCLTKQNYSMTRITTSLINYTQE